MKKSNLPKKRKNPRKKFKANVLPISEVKPFPIVGIGASAGGLEALEQFFGQVPENVGLAFVIVQHLAPNRKGIMSELLQRSTSMNVRQVRDRTRVRPNCVYVIPPNKDLSILNGVLHLIAPIAPHGVRLPVDFFFRSLAADQHDRSIGVILSGMGTDGTLGLHSIKEQAGIVLVQEPSSAKFDSMPRSAIEARLADIVAPAEELPGRLLDYLKNPSWKTRQEKLPKDKPHGHIEAVLVLIRGQTGHDFSLYKRSTISRRIERRMGLHQIIKMGTYVRFLRENPQEIELLFRELLIGVTGFFRDPDAWAQLRDEIIPLLLKKRSGEREFRAWVPGCSTGEEAYSLAIAFKEALEQVRVPNRFALQIFATDLDRDAVNKARQGFYQASITAEISPKRLKRFFVKEREGHRVANEIREMIIFAQQNLIQDPPFTRLDLLICRNLLIYLSPELQRRVLPLFHYSLKPGGVLFLGSSESIGGFSDLFEPFPGKSRLFLRKHSGKSRPIVGVPNRSGRRLAECA